MFNKIILFIVLFDDGDVPGDRMFGFNLKERKPTTSKISPLKTPNSKTKTITKYEIIQSNKSQQYDKKRSNIHSQGKILNVCTLSSKKILVNRK